MSKCPNCGSESSGRFCSVCGTPVVPPQQSQNVQQPSQQPTQQTAPMPEPVPVVTPEVVTPPPAKKSGNALKVLMWCGIGLLIAAVVGTGVYFLCDYFFGEDTEYVSGSGKNKKQKNKDGEEEPDYPQLDTATIQGFIDNNTSYTDFGIYVYNTKTGYEYCYHADDEFLASAMGQVVILNALGKVTKAEKVDVDYESVYFEYLSNGKQAPSSPYEDGEYISLRQCIEDVAIYGDNNKSNLIVDYIAELSYEYNGFDVINEMMDDEGYVHTRINRKTFVDPALVDNSVEPNKTSPREIALIFDSLINHGRFGDKDYMMNIFSCLTPQGEPIGLKKFIPTKYDSCNANALTTQSSNDVAIISNGDTELVVAILSTTAENKTSVEGSKQREAAQREIIEYIMANQFEE